MCGSSSIYGISKNTAKRLYRVAPQWEAERLPCQSKRAGGRHILTAGKRTCQKERHRKNTQSRKLNGMGTADERSTGNSNGNRQ